MALHFTNCVHTCVQGQAAVMKKIPDITDQALKKALGEMERSIRDTKREAWATDERITAMDSQRAQLTEEVSSGHDRSAHLAGRVCFADTLSSDHDRLLFLTG